MDSFSSFASVETSAALSFERVQKHFSACHLNARSLETIRVTPERGRVIVKCSDYQNFRLLMETPLSVEGISSEFISSAVVADDLMVLLLGAESVETYQDDGATCLAQAIRDYFSAGCETPHVAFQEDDIIVLPLYGEDGNLISVNALVKCSSQQSVDLIMMTGTCKRGVHDRPIRPGGPKLFTLEVTHALFVTPHPPVPVVDPICHLNPKAVEFTPSWLLKPAGENLVALETPLQTLQLDDRTQVI